MGEGMREFKDSVSGKDVDDEPAELPDADDRRDDVSDATRARARPRLDHHEAPTAAPPSSGEEATLVEHLDELRARIFVSLGALAVGFAIAFVFHRHLLHWLNAPLPADRGKPVTLGVAEPFLTAMKVSLMAGFALALPVVLWQLWSFLAPAVEPHAERLVLMFVAARDRSRLSSASRSATSSCCRRRSTS